MSSTTNKKWKSLSEVESGKCSEHLTLASRAYQEIRNKILKGEFSADAILSRRQIAKELKISLPPVYEAIQKLENDGLLESRSRVGTRLRIPTQQEVFDRGMVREALESQAARLFAKRATEHERRTLMNRAEKLDGMYDAWMKGRADREFLYDLNTYHLQLHLLIAECSGSDALRDAIEREQVLIFNWFYDTVGQRRVMGRHFHAQLATALVSGKPLLADRAMRKHIHFGLREVLATISTLDQDDRGWRLRKSDKIDFDED